MDISQESLKEYCHYEPETGIFTRIKAMNWRHKGNVGKPCGCLNKATGYVEFHVGGALRYGHRLAWIYMHGCIPEGARIDHKDTNRANNKIGNLRLSTHSENLRNCKVRIDNRSGVKGVGFDASRGKWTAHVCTRKLGRFDTLFDAVCARKSAALAVFGEFARE
ncbi:MAG: HNH endonuclease [Rhodoferax sp.]|jgi:hypothetical protein|uniref:HNH endonuclease n=1 Tax=Rhodoferax sp. TaxID=50421 RepID=UPI001B77D8E2|nr:HNH endonuclease [Rhodoferax sp.]MBP9148707.1 HNH endonuclease [Rhodoferax sp.]MBP9736259.1 HNH endonuclease [Rhodoferax sp.]